MKQIKRKLDEPLASVKFYKDTNYQLKVLKLALDQPTLLDTIHHLLVQFRDAAPEPAARPVRALNKRSYYSQTIYQCDNELLAELKEALELDSYALVMEAAVAAYYTSHQTQPPAPAFTRPRLPDEATVTNESSAYDKFMAILSGAPYRVR